MLAGRLIVAFITLICLIEFISFCHAETASIEQMEAELSEMQAKFNELKKEGKGSEAGPLAGKIREKVLLLFILRVCFLIYCLLSVAYR